MNLEFNDGNIDAVFWEEFLRNQEIQNTVVPDCLKPKLTSKRLFIIDDTPRTIEVSNPLNPDNIDLDPQEVIAIEEFTERLLEKNFPFGLPHPKQATEGDSING